MKFDPATNLPLKRAAVVCWDLSHNPVGRAAVLCKLLETDWTVELIGPIWRRFGNSLWKPVQGEGLTVRSFHPSTLPDVWREGAKIALGRRYDIVIICKPRLPGLVLGLLLAEQSGCPLERELADPRLCGRIVRHPPFAISEIGVFLAAADLVPILQDPDTLIARTQLPAKLVDALWYGLATVATDVEPIRDIAACGVVDVIAGADFAGYLKALRARPPQPRLPDQRKRVFAGEFGSAVNRARLAAAIREATMRHDPERSRVRARLARLLAETRVAAAAVREAAAETATKHRRSLAQTPDLAFFWKQNDSGLFGRRSDHVVEHLLLFCLTRPHAVLTWLVATASS